MDFKVGQRVWAKEHYNIPKGFYTIRNFTNNGFYIENENGIGGSVFVFGIHQTADSMFEELGYEMFNKGAQLIFKNKQYQIVFDKVFEGYYIDRLVGNIETFINTQLHLAVHQKLIELGWIE